MGKKDEEGVIFCALKFGLFEILCLLRIIYKY